MASAARGEAGAGAIGAGALAADAGAFEKEDERIGHQVGVGDAGCATEAGKAVAVRRLEALDETAGGMFGLGEFDRRIGERAAASVDEDAAAALLHPAVQLRERVAGIARGERLPHGFDFVGDFLQAGDDEIVLRAEMPIERHLVAAGGFGDRLDADGAQAMPVEQVARGGDDPLARARPLALQAIGQT